MKAFQISAIGLAILASLYQLFLKDLLFVSLGINRIVQPINDFEYSCRRIRHEFLQGCESMRIDDDARKLYAACTTSNARTQWNPAMGNLNVSGRREGGDYISVLDLDSPGKDGLFNLHQMVILGYNPAENKEDNLAFVGIDIERISNDLTRLWAVNHRPSINSQNILLDQTKYGANSTIEVFEIAKDSPDKLVHIQTIASDLIYSPNGITATGDGGFLVTNDRSCKVCIRKEFDLLMGSGNIASFDASTQTVHIAAKKGFNFPNGMVKGDDDLYYVPSSFLDMIRVMKFNITTRTLHEISVIKVGMPVDNLSVDKNGDIYAAGIPKILRLLASLQDPHNIDAPSTIFRIRKKRGSIVDFDFVKVLEDRDAKVIGGVTTAVYDVATSRLFMGGAAAPYITVCEAL